MTSGAVELGSQASPQQRKGMSGAHGVEHAVKFICGPKETNERLALYFAS